MNMESWESGYKNLEFRSGLGSHYSSVLVQVLSLTQLSVTNYLPSLELSLNEFLTRKIAKTSFS